MGDAIIDGMKNEIERQSFRSHVGRQIFCVCKSVLDVRKSVAVYVWLEKCRVALPALIAFMK